MSLGILRSVDIPVPQGVRVPLYRGNGNSLLTLEHVALDSIKFSIFIDGNAIYNSRTFAEWETVLSDRYILDGELVEVVSHDVSTSMEVNFKQI